MRLLKNLGDWLFSSNENDCLAFDGDPEITLSQLADSLRTFSLTQEDTGVRIIPRFC